MPSSRKHFPHMYDGIQPPAKESPEPEVEQTATNAPDANDSPPVEGMDQANLTRLLNEANLSGIVSEGLIALAEKLGIPQNSLNLPPNAPQTALDNQPQNAPQPSFENLTEAMGRPDDSLGQEEQPEHWTFTMDPIASTAPPEAAAPKEKAGPDSDEPTYSDGLQPARPDQPKLAPAHTPALNITN